MHIKPVSVVRLMWLVNASLQRLFFAVIIVVAIVYLRFATRYYDYHWCYFFSRIGCSSDAQRFFLPFVLHFMIWIAMLNGFYAYATNTYMNEQLTTNRESIAKIESSVGEKMESFRRHTGHINIDANRAHFPFPRSLHCTPCVQYVRSYYSTLCTCISMNIYAREKKIKKKKLSNIQWALVS